MERTHHFFLFFAIGLIFSFCSCSTSEVATEDNKVQFIAASKPSHLHPPLIQDPSARLIAKQVFQGLVKLNPLDLSVEPCLAKEISYDPTTYTYTFKLRKNVLFHNDKCFAGSRTLNADDVIFTFKNLCTKQTINAAYLFTLKGVVKGVNDYYDGAANDISGIRKIDEYTIEIELNRPNSLFLKKLTDINFAIISKEALAMYGMDNIVGTGPFIPQKFDRYREQLVLIKNQDYYGEDKKGVKLPYLDSIVIKFDEQLKSQISNTLEGSLSFVPNLPYKAVKRVLKNNKNAFDKTVKMQNAPFLATHFIEFNLKDSLLQNIHLRKAISYALNKQEITYKVFGETRGKIGDAGITHPFLPNYIKNGVNGYTFNIDSAKSCLRQANLSSRISLDLDISQDDYKALSIADEIRFQLDEHLSINVKINVVPHQYKIEKCNYARGQMTISRIVANYQSPDGFLRSFYGNNVPESIDKPSPANTSRFKNKIFDRMLNRARGAIDERNANESFAAAERLLMNECPIAVLWYDETNRLIRSDLQNFPLNQLQHIDFTEVYLSK